MDINRQDITALAELVASQVRREILAELAPGRWLTIRQAMAYAQVKSVNTIKGWINNGYIYAHKRTGQWIVDRESIDDWFSSEKVKLT